MKKLLLHIGTPKTGSSSIQNALATTKPSDMNVRYPLVGGIDHYFLSALYREWERLPLGYKRAYKNNRVDFEERKEKYKQALFGEIRRSEAVILSSESLYDFEIRDVEALMNDIKACGYSSVRVLVYVRDPADMYLSAMQQRLKNGPKIAPPRRFNYKFKKAILNWQHGVDDIVVRSFDRNKLVGGGVVSDFCETASHFFVRPVLNSPIAEQNQNESMAAEAMIALQACWNEIGTSSKTRDNVYNVLRHILLDRYGESFGSKAELAPQVANYVRRKHLNDYLFVSEKYNLKIDRMNALTGSAQPAENNRFNATKIEKLLNSYSPELVEEVVTIFVQQQI